MHWRRRDRLLATAIALAGAVAVLVVSLRVFPYHSLNNDEGVYLQQAGMLLDGNLFLRPPVENVFRPWFFVEAGDRLYPKYAPVTAAMFAVGKLLGSYRIALGVVAAAVLALTYATVAEAFDRRRGLLAAAFVATSPLFLIDAAVFLPYAPTTALNLLFAWAYLRADRTGSLRWAALAGGAAGLAFFARPYTATLFAAPFVCHAVWRLRAGDADESASIALGPVRLDRSALRRQSVTAALGLAGVGVTLAYNAVVTGDPLLFPYQAFAPLDGLGFGHREILGYDRNYTPELAVRANAAVLQYFFTEWVAAGVLGSALAGLGVGVALWRTRPGIDRPGPEIGSDGRPEAGTDGGARVGAGLDARRAALLGVVVTVVAGNVYFWGNLNVLGDLTDPTDGLVSYLGPYYHFDLLLPTAAFAAHGTAWLAGRVRAAILRTADGERSTLPTADGERSTRQARALAVTALVVGAAVFGTAAVVVASDPVGQNLAVTDRYERAYQPFEERDLTGSLVLLPQPYGNWLNHPFQAVRNDPDFDGPTVYATDERPFATVDAYPDRQVYRYVFRGQWDPTGGPGVTPRIQHVHRARGAAVTVRTTLGVPESAESVSIRLSGSNATAYYAGTAAAGSDLDLQIRLADGNATVLGAVDPQGRQTVLLPDRGTVRVTAFVDYGRGQGFSYRIAVPVDRTGETVRALTPRLEVCEIATRCGGEAAYVPGAFGDGIAMAVDLRATNGTRGSVADPSQSTPP